MTGRIFVLFIAILISTMCFAAEQSEPETENRKDTALPKHCMALTDDEGFKMDVLAKDMPFKKRKMIKGAFITPVIKYPIMGDYMNVFAGLRGAMIFNHHFAMGITGNFMLPATTNRELTGDDITKKRMFLQYGGPYFEYYFFPDKIVHLSVGMTAGAGWLSDEFFSLCNGRISYFFALEPELNLYLNVSKRHRLGIGASYLFTHGARMYEVRDKDIRNFSISCFAQLGIF
ncbi:MAG TPA: hypothetical protein PK926_02900 [Spirochaetota bacterium]|nr:hypothetical protein [Spirochaetota bacterium]HPI87971.1 hypothetical protein [Spirochaetota bacterium]HPR46682.1 hypothetical protein [Spirochaetota bacterium]